MSINLGDIVSAALRGMPWIGGPLSSLFDSALGRNRGVIHAIERGTGALCQDVQSLTRAVDRRGEQLLGAINGHVVRAATVIHEDVQDNSEGHLPIVHSRVARAAGMLQNKKTIRVSQIAHH